MSQHNEQSTSDGEYPNTCTCGWKAYGAYDRIEGWRDLRQHLSNEWAKEDEAARAEKERVRLLTQGQNWDMP